MIGGAPTASAQNAAFDMMHKASLDAPRGATAMANFRLPLGNAPDREEPTFGLSFGFGRTAGAGELTPHTKTRLVRLVDIRLDQSARLRNARVGSFDLANPDKNRRLNLFGGANDTVWLVGGAVLIGVGVCLFAECFDGDGGEEVDDD
jgi:hypothetical protein